MKRIPLSQNQYAIVDEQDFDRLGKYKWGGGVGNIFGGFQGIF